MITKDAPICDRKLWDSLGNSCRVQMYCIGPDEFELWVTRFNSDVPVRYRGPIGIMNSVADSFLAARKAEGFEEQLPSYNPAVRV
jgi:hypothetical protein